MTRRDFIGMLAALPFVKLGQTGLDRIRMSRSYYGKPFPVVMGTARQQASGGVISHNETRAILHSGESVLPPTMVREMRFTTASVMDDPALGEPVTRRVVIADRNGVRDSEGRLAGHWQNENTLVIYPEAQGLRIGIEREISDAIRNGFTLNATISS